MFNMTLYSWAFPDYSSYPISLFTEFEVIVLFINLPVNEANLSPPISYVVNVSFNIVGCIFMLNLLASMMGDTQGRVGEERDELWRTQVRRRPTSRCAGRPAVLRAVVMMFRWWLRF